MAFTAYHNIVGSTAQNVELIAVEDMFSHKVNNIQLTNVHTAEATIDLYIFRDSTNTRAMEVYYLLKRFAIPTKAALVLDNSDLLRFDNTKDGYSLYITVGATDKIDVFIAIGPKK